MTNLEWKLVFPPLSGRVYVNLLEGNWVNNMKIWEIASHIGTFSLRYCLKSVTRVSSDVPT